MSVRSTEACWVVWIGAPDEMRIQITVPMSDTHTEGRVNPRMHVTRTQPVTCVQRCSAGMLATELTTACGVGVLSSAAGSLAATTHGFVPIPRPGAAGGSSIDRYRYVRVRQQS